MMRQIVLMLAILAVLLLVAGSELFAREWTDKTGNYTVEAEFVDAKDGMVRLKRADGKTISLPLAKLSEADQQFVIMQDKEFCESIVNRIAHEWAIKYALNLGDRLGSADVIIQLAVNSQEATIEQRYALWLAMKNSPNLRTPLAVLREAAVGQGEDPFLAKVSLQTKQLEATSVTSLKLLANVEQEQNRVVAGNSKLDAIDARYATAVLAAELAANKELTADLAVALVRYNAARAKSPSDKFLLAENDIEIQMNSAITAERGQYLAKAIKILNDLRSDELVESRKRARTLIKEAVDKNPELLLFHAQVFNRKNTASGDPLLDERKRVWSLIEESTK